MARSLYTKVLNLRKKALKTPNGKNVSRATKVRSLRKPGTTVDKKYFSASIADEQIEKHQDLLAVLKAGDKILQNEFIDVGELEALVDRQDTYFTF